MSWIGFKLDSSIGVAHDLVEYLDFSLLAFLVAQVFYFQLVLVLKCLLCFFQKLWVSDCHEVISMHENRHICFRIPEQAGVCLSPFEACCQ